MDKLDKRITSGNMNALGVQMLLSYSSCEWGRQLVVAEGHLLPSLYMMSNLIDNRPVNPPAICLDLYKPCSIFSLMLQIEYDSFLISSKESEAPQMQDEEGGGGQSISRLRTYPRSYHVEVSVGCSVCKSQPSKLPRHLHSTVLSHSTDLLLSAFE